MKNLKNGTYPIQKKVALLLIEGLSTQEFTAVRETKLGTKKKVKATRYIGRQD